MKKIFISLFFTLLFLAYLLNKKESKSVYTYLQNVSCVVKTFEGYRGSGIVKISKGKVFVITAAHVVENTQFDYVFVITYDYKNEKRVNTNIWFTKIIKVSHKEDLALLHICEENNLKDSVRIDPLVSTKIGEKVIFVSSPFSDEGYNTVTEGIISQHDRIVHGKRYYQISCEGFPGCSGGGCFSNDGELIGIAVIRMNTTGNTLLIPIKDIINWIRENGLLYLIDHKRPLPEGL